MNQLSKKNKATLRYQDYVIKDGKFIGEFESMYQNVAEVPWHQDKTAYDLICEFDLTILRHFYSKCKWRKILDVGCGLGYFTSRLKKNFFNCKVVGCDS